MEGIQNYLYLAPIIGGVIGLIGAVLFAIRVVKSPIGNEKMEEIASAISEGAMAFISREYRIIAIFVVVMAVILGKFISPGSALCFVAGAICSGLAGFVGMKIATKANSRTSQAARKGVGPALKVAFSGGAVMGLTVVGLGLVGLGGLYMIFKGRPDAETVDIIKGFALGASSIALFARVGGGIYTKAADVGADLVGKVEAGIPEDDPRNPAVIADNVGDNVGDVAGMGADLFESFVGSIVAAMALGVVKASSSAGIMLPMVLAAIGVIATIIGTLFVRTEETGKVQKALMMGLIVSSVIVIIGAFFATRFMIGSTFGIAAINVFWAIVAGLLAGVVIGVVTLYYTADNYKPVQDLAESAQTGPATVVIAGLSLGMISTIVPVLAICVAIFISYHLAGLYGIAIAAVGMLSTAGMTISVDAYGPIADNAGGISEMAQLPPEVRGVTDKLDSVGNTTAAIGKGFAIGSAALTALALFSAYTAACEQAAGGVVFSIDITEPKVIIGLFIGALLPYVFGALTMSSVGRTAFRMIEEVRRQFKEVKGIMEGTTKPDYASCVSISTDAALWQMIVPASMAVVVPILVGIFMGPKALGGLLAGALISGFLMAVFMANAGGAWDNAKKYIEAGNLGGKGTPVHAAAVVGDTVGDPLKDTSGPSMNILIKLMSIVSLVFVPLFF
ncbi:MAG: sodium-translocating pyrophosphatase [bacterium]|nr:sodium-translocating pyrophosphatase [bacterium]